MPIYEYTCPACGHRFEKLVRSISAGQSGVACPNCREQRVERLVSTFALAGGGTAPSFDGPPLSNGGG